MIMKKYCLVACIVLSGCTTTTGPVVIRDAGDLPKRPSVSDSSTTQSGSTHKAGGSDTSPAVVQPVSPTSQSASSTSPLKKKLLQQSQQKISEQDAQGAIVLAERGLRIDRKEPHFYHVLAEAYDLLANKTQSVYFAKQGLRYAPTGSDIYRALQQWLD